MSDYAPDTGSDVPQGDDLSPTHIHASGTSPDHVPSVSCWCHPEQVSDGVYLHSDSGNGPRH